METQHVASVDLVQDAIAILQGIQAADCPEDCIDLNQQVEQAKRMLCAAQAGNTHQLMQLRNAEEHQLDIPDSQRLQGLGAEIGLSRGESPYLGGAFTLLADALHTVLPMTLATFQAGLVSEYHVRLVAEQTSHLRDVHRRAIDEAINHRLGTASTSQLRKLIEGHAFRLDRKAAEARAEHNKARRRVCLDRASESSVYVTAELPTQQGLAAMQALERKARQRIAALQALDPDATPLSLEQAIADLFVELLTGQTTANGVAAELIVVMTDTTLVGDDDLPAWILGHGPLPSGTAKDWLADPTAKKFLRRMYTRPTDGQLVALESSRRRFPPGLVKMLRLRDDSCATPWCNSPVQDADHRTPWAAGGTTSWQNATGLCSRCNQRKELRGWTYSGTPDELTVTTPTGHSYAVPTRPPLSELAYGNTDPPNIGVIDIQFPVTNRWDTAA